MTGTVVAASLLVGMGLGARFKILILIPALALVFLTSPILGLVGTVAAVTSLQVGYFGGVAVNNLAVVLKRKNQAQNHTQIEKIMST
jgi:hypothetical protein